MQRFEHPRARLLLTGPDRVRFLHGMVTCDVEKLADGAGSRAAMLSVKGRLLADLVVYATEEGILLSMEAPLGEKVRALLDKHIVMDDVEVADRTADTFELGLYGDDAATIASSLLDVAPSMLHELAPYHHVRRGELRVARDPALGLFGLRVFGARAELDGVIAKVGGETLAIEGEEVLRVEAGTARYGVDLDEDRLVVEANLDDAISFDKGCYLGQEVVVRATSRGRVNRKLVGLVVSGDATVPGRTKLRSDAQPDAGMTTSSVVSPRFGAIALGYVHAKAIDAGGPLFVGDGDRRALVVPLPFDRDAVSAARARLST